jgi:hypothetical protein
MSCGLWLRAPVDLHKAAAGVRGAQTIGFPQKGGHRVVGVHSFFLEFDLGLLPPAGRAELIESDFGQSLAAIGELDPAFDRLDVNRDGAGLRAGCDGDAQDERHDNQTGESHPGASPDGGIIS